MERSFLSHRIRSFFRSFVLSHSFDSLQTLDPIRVDAQRERDFPGEKNKGDCQLQISRVNRKTRRLIT